MRKMLMLTKIIYNTPQSFSFFRVFPCQSKSYFSSLPLQFLSFLLLLRLHSLALVSENVPFSAKIFAFKFSAKKLQIIAMIWVLPQTKMSLQWKCHTQNFTNFLSYWVTSTFRFFPGLPLLEFELLLFLGFDSVIGLHNEHFQLTLQRRNV